jgi:hypothetical protein
MTIVMAADATVRTGTFKASYDARLVRGSGAPITFQGSGVVDGPGHRSRVSVDLASLAVEAGARGSRDAFRGVEVVDSNGQVVVYVRVPFYARRLPATRPWLRVDYGQTVHRQGIAVGTLTLDQDPGQYLEFLRGAAGKTTKVGKETVGGVATTHYSTTIELFDFPKSYTGDRKFAAEQLADRIVQLTQRSSFPTDVWVDDQGRVRQLTFDYAIPGSATGTPIDYRVRLRYSGFGSQARVLLPPANQVATISQLKTS